MARMKATGAACSCTPGSLIWVLIGLIVVAAGIFFLAKAFLMQMGGETGFAKLVFWYALGLLIMCIGRAFKMKACGYCFG